MLQYFMEKPENIPPEELWQAYDIHHFAWLAALALVGILLVRWFCHCEYDRQTRILKVFAVLIVLNTYTVPIPRATQNTTARISPSTDRTRYLGFQVSRATRSTRSTRSSRKSLIGRDSQNMQMKTFSQKVSSRHLKTSGTGTSSLVMTMYSRVRNL